MVTTADRRATGVPGGSGHEAPAGNPRCCGHRRDAHRDPCRGHHDPDCDPLRRDAGLAFAVTSTATASSMAFESVALGSGGYEGLKVLYHVIMYGSGAITIDGIVLPVGTEVTSVRDQRVSMTSPRRSKPGLPVPATSSRKRGTVVFPRGRHARNVSRAATAAPRTRIDRGASVVGYALTSRAPSEARLDPVEAEPGVPRRPQTPARPCTNDTRPACPGRMGGEDG